MIFGLEMLHHLNLPAINREPTAFVLMKDDTELRLKAIKRLEQMGCKQPKVPQIIAEIKRMTGAR